MSRIPATVARERAGRWGEPDLSTDIRASEDLGGDDLRGEERREELTAWRRRAETPMCEVHDTRRIPGPLGMAMPEITVRA
ncbi:hypothetical protein Sliba_25420 [Streptomyces nigrescens]|uniref:Uncharacterized protein n=1 Tax=Streptomyces nigrescens TaxID=1920 RepID=A0A640TEH9_STRNI|nr:hypothetical protein Sliba_25420 [Streptomyces libani subsp. libani]GGV89981.1 hypothetical protein GCM10010500_16240 [Streptomyces libani subsp. libani]